MAQKRKAKDEELFGPNGEELADISCELCRDRKLKCSREKPLCSFCTSRGETSCRYTHIIRTQLTRKNLDAAEAKIAELEALLAAAAAGLPHVDEQPRPPLRSPSSKNEAGRTPSNASASPREPLQLAESAQRPAATSRPWVPDTGTLQFRIPQGPGSTAHLFQRDSTEDAEEGQGDGTGSLLLDGMGSGFLGSISGAALLKFLQRCATDVQLLKSSRPPANSPSPQSTVPATVPHPDRAPLYLDAYFQMLHKQYPIIHEASFRAQLSDVIPRPGGQSWHVLHTAILGLGTLCVAEQPDQSESHGYMSRINSLLTPTLYDFPSITSVQAFTLLGNLAQKLNKPTAGSIYLGIALRMAISLGLHKEPDSSLPLFEQESRRRIWWVLFVFDSGAQITFGHPSTLPTYGVDVRLLSNVLDEQLTPATLYPPHPCDSPTIYSSLIYQSLFHQLSNRITAQITQAPISAQEALALESELLAWQSNLPSYFFDEDPAWFDFARYRMVWRYLNLRMIILRPSFFRAAWPQGERTAEDELCWERCLASATATIGSVQSFMSKQSSCTSTEWWYALHFLFSACFVPLIALRTRSTSNASFEWLVAVQNALEVLQRVKHNSLASRCADIIEAVITRVPSSQAAPQLDLPQNLMSIFGDTATSAETADSLASALTTPFDALIAQWLTQEGSDLVV